VSEQSTLKPCPFCGGSALEVEGDLGKQWVFCHGCGTSGPVGDAHQCGVWNEATQAEAASVAVEKWNRRASA
jgi:Lar family restriction alleviation protein